MKFIGVCLITKNVPTLADFYSKVLGVSAEGDATHMALHTGGASIAVFSIEGMEGMALNSMQGAGYGSITREYRGFLRRSQRVGLR
jgi:predicted enzyme related to lactoylglutathione lyase